MRYLLGLRAICLDFKSHIRLLLSEPFGEQLYIYQHLSKRSRFDENEFPKKDENIHGTNFSSQGEY
jgi:hypothetical protein